MMKTNSIGGAAGKPGKNPGAPSSKAKSSEVPANPGDDLLGNNDHDSHRRLTAVEDWKTLAKASGYRVADAASSIRVSRQWLNKWIHKRYDTSPHHLFAQWRREEKARLAETGLHGDTLARELGFASRGNLTRGTRDEASGKTQSRTPLEQGRPGSNPSAAL